MWGGGRQNLTKYNNAPLSVIKIVKYYKVGRGGIGGGAPKCYKNIGALLLFVNKMAKYCDVWGGGERQNPTKDNGAPSVCH